MILIAGHKVRAISERRNVGVFRIPHAGGAGKKIADHSRARRRAVAEPHLPSVHAVIGRKEHAIMKRRKAEGGIAAVQRALCAGTNVRDHVRAGFRAVADPQLPTRSGGEAFKKDQRARYDGIAAENRSDLYSARFSTIRFP